MRSLEDRTCVQAHECPKKIPYNDLGCWKDISRKTIPSVEDQLSSKFGSYKLRKNAIEVCAQFAKSKGFTVFAVQNGGRCCTSRDARQRFDKYGPSIACRPDGEGGPWSSQVYEIGKPRPARYTFLGCFKDTIKRAIPPVEGQFAVLRDGYQGRVKAISKCAQVAASLGYKVFSVQNGGWCATGPKAHMTYEKYGTSRMCNRDGEGGIWANAVYSVNGWQPEKYPTLTFTDLGCWRDTAERAIRGVDGMLQANYGPYKSRADAIQRCARYAKARGNSVFAVQDGGWCATSYRARNTFNKYGPSKACRLNGKGGAWANQVYEIQSSDVIKQVSFKLIGCYKDTAKRAIPTLEGRFASLRDNYQQRQKAVIKCAHAAAALSYKVFAVQNGGWCASGARAQNSFMKYGPSQACQRNGKGGPWANAVYGINGWQPIANGPVNTPIQTKESKLVVNDLGCWKDTGARAISGVDHLIAVRFGPYKSRKDAVQLCARYADNQGFRVFAVQDGGWCATAANAGSTFDKFGPSAACKGDGKGGPWANRVYSVGTAIQIEFRPIGCFKDKSDKRAIPGVEGRFLSLQGPYQVRPNAIKKCARIAASMKYRAFAIQNGGWCATGPQAHNTYDTHGYSTSCPDDGRGGPWANAVYFLTTGYSITLDNLGCFRDRLPRAIPSIEGKALVNVDLYTERSDAIEKCARAAAVFGYTTIGLQDGGSCMSSKNAYVTYNKYGRSDQCKADGEGGPWANQVYTLEARKLNFMNSDQPTFYVLNDLGCWKDLPKRAIAVADDLLKSRLGAYKTRVNAVQECARYAAQRGYNTFAVQDGGQCMTSGVAKRTFMMYGPSSGCKNDGKGGAWANQVYSIGTVLKVNFRYIGCFKDQPSRAIPLVERRFSTLRDNYLHRTQAIEKCARVAASLNYKVFGVQHQGQCFTGPQAHKTFGKYGPSIKCLDNGKGAAWASAVYELTEGASISLKNLGCYRDIESIPHSIPTLERTGVLMGDVSKRVDAIEDCARYASSLGYSVIGIQGGGACMSSQFALTSYKMYGPSDKCESDLRGGVLANQVFQLTVVEQNYQPSLPFRASYRPFYLNDLGCWAEETKLRAIPNKLEGRLLTGDYRHRTYAIQRCAEAAALAGYDIFGVQDGGQCWSGPGVRKTYTKYGVSRRCVRGLGALWANNVYEINTIWAPEITGVGCFHDKTTRAIASLETTSPQVFGGRHKKDAIQKCARLAASRGFKMFGIQFGGLCFGSADAEERYDMYGRSTRCGSNGRGGYWASSVYRITKPTKFFIQNLGCWAEDTFQTIPRAEGLSAELRCVPSYKEREDAIGKCARFAFSKGYTVFALQDGGMCSTSADAERTYRRAGPSFGCGRHGKGGHMANQVYKITKTPVGIPTQIIMDK